jgi:TetR/AcrR family transcriptional regulator
MSSSDPSGVPGAPTRQRRKAERPQELLDAALTVFVEKGLRATRMEDVAKLAGVSKGTLYLYYSSKEELFKAVVRGALLPALAEVKDIAERWQGATGDLLLLLMRTWWQRMGAAPGADVFKLVVTDVGNVPELAQFYLEEIMQPSYVLLGSTLQRGIDRGEFRAVDINTLVQLLMASAQFLALHTHCTRHIVDNPFPMQPEVFMKTQMDLLLHGLEIRQP